MKIRRFNESFQPINESVSTLYRLVSVPKGEPLVVDTLNPGKYYFVNKNAIDTSLIDNDGDLHVIKVTTPSSNIDSEASELESRESGKGIGNAIVVLKDDSKATIENIEPYKK